MAKKPGPKRNYATGRTRSGAIATVLSAIADRLTLANALSPQGALVRSLLVGPLRLAARVFRWWSRSYLGQRLGWSWSRRTYKAGSERLYDASDIGNAWKEFEGGRVTLRPPSERR